MAMTNSTIGRRNMIAAGSCGLLLRARPALSLPRQTTLYRQSVWSDTIDKHFSVTNAAPPYNPIGVDYVHANQPNPYRSDSAFVPVSWPIGNKTGFFTTGNVLDHQRGILNTTLNTAYGRSAVQVQGGVVGAYLNSADLFKGSPHKRMMVAQQIAFDRSRLVTPFASPTALLRFSMDLQVPTATDAGIQGVSNTYASPILLFTHGSNGDRVAFQVGVFGHGSDPQGEGFNFDPVTNSAIIGAFMLDPARGLLSSYVTVLPGSATHQSAPWRGWQSFAFTVSTAQFARALSGCVAIARAHGLALPARPADYVLSSYHLNAELHYPSGQAPRATATSSSPVTMGWSVQNTTITLVA